MSALRLNPNLLQVPLYISGRSIEEVKAELGLGEVVKLASNESPVGPSPLAVQAAAEMLVEAHRYPGVAERDLRCRLAAALNPRLTPEHIVTGNGGTDILRMVTQAFVFDGGNAVTGQATFPMYRILTVAFGGTPRLVDLTNDGRFDLAAMARQIDDDTRLIFLCTPNNPTGQIITRAEADDFMERVPAHIPVVFDESYIDYVTDADPAPSLDYVLADRPALAVRSFSKTAGLANFRVGYLVAPLEIANYVRRAQLPFHTGAIALAAATASLNDQAYHERHQAAVATGRAYLQAEFRRLKLAYLPSQANFITILDPPLGATGLVQALLHQGVIVRAMGAFGLPEAIRVSVGSPAANETLVAALERVMSK